ncbi:hypothetical protein JXA88_12825 [Candidatus Fermentibacteria bacterium]|nr:hypothetical protein [Candidatus Fermentibacteria bacterium]
MLESFDVQAEADRWMATGLSGEALDAALAYLVASATEACQEERRLVEALRRELAYSLTWPQEIGGQTLVSRAYTHMGPLRFPIPGDPEPLRQSLEAHEERLKALDALIRHAEKLRQRLEERRKSEIPSSTPDA